MTLSELSSKLEHITNLNSQEYHELFSCVEYDFKHPIIIKPLVSDTFTRTNRVLGIGCELNF